LILNEESKLLANQHLGLEISGEISAHPDVTCHRPAALHQTHQFLEPPAGICVTAGRMQNSYNAQKPEMMEISTCSQHFTTHLIHLITVYPGILY